MANSRQIKMMWRVGWDYDKTYIKTISDVLTTATDKQLETFCQKLARLVDGYLLTGEKIETSQIYSPW